MIRNFLFHRVNPKRDALWDPMDVSLFDKCVKHISNKYETILFEELAFSDNINTANRYATIMFDDGFKDNMEYAIPILEKYRCKASFYVVTDCIDKNIPTWTFILEFLFQFSENEDLILDFEFLLPELRIKKLVGKEAKLNYVKKLKPFLKKLSDHERDKVINCITASFSDVELPRIMMNWDDLKEIQNAGHYIGSHTLSHQMLGTMSNSTEIKNELLGSGNRIKEMLGYFPLTISYPVGSYNETTKKIAQETGYKIGLAVKQNIFNPQKDDMFEIPRIELYNESWFKTKLRISNTLENIKSLIRYR